MLLLFYVMFVYFMLSVSDNSSCGYCYLLTVRDVKKMLSNFILSVFVLKEINNTDQRGRKVSITLYALL